MVSRTETETGIETETGETEVENMVIAGIPTTRETLMIPETLGIGGIIHMTLVMHTTQETSGIPETLMIQEISGILETLMTPEIQGTEGIQETPGTPETPGIPETQGTLEIRGT